MNKGKTISKLLGLKQEELAMLLKVHKSQLAMFETGKRGLPAAALLVLAPMLEFVQKVKLQSGSAEVLKSQVEQKRKVVTYLLKENKYHQTEISKKLEKLEDKYQVNLSVIQLMRFLEEEAIIKGETPDVLLKLIESRAATDLKKNNWEVIIKYKIKYEVLKAEEKVLLEMLF